MQLLVGVSPVMVTLLALVLGVRSLYAAFLGVTTAVFASLIAFPVPIASLLPALVRWVPILVEVLAIIGGGFLLSEALRHAGAQSELAAWVKERAGGGVGAEMTNWVKTVDDILRRARG
jgi:lactate permease